MRSSARHLLFLPGVVFVLSGCTHKVSKFYPQFIPKKFETTMTLKPNGAQTVNVLYLGCGNLVLEKDGEAIMTDPFFSTQGILKLLGRIKTSPERYSQWLETLEAKVPVGAVKATLISHTHYDHVMDLPVLLQNHVFPKMKAVYGNPYMPEMMQHFKDTSVQLVGLQPDQVFNPNEANDKAYQWISVSPRIRFLPIESNHAPHVGHKLYMSKPLKEKYFKNNLVWSGDKVKAFKWTVGKVYSFLVDFIGTDTLRIFIQTSASEHPNGFPPQAELKKKKVDLAIICYASAPNVDDYPRLLLNRLSPKKVMFVHWEDFFRIPRNPDDLKLVRGTKPKKVKKRIEALKRPPKERDFFMMPKPETFIHVTY